MVSHFLSSWGFSGRLSLSSRVVHILFHQHFLKASVPSSPSSLRSKFMALLWSIPHLFGICFFFTLSFYIPKRTVLWELSFIKDWSLIFPQSYLIMFAVLSCVWMETFQWRTAWRDRHWLTTSPPFPNHHSHFLRVEGDLYFSEALPSWEPVCFPQEQCRQCEQGPGRNALSCTSTPSCPCCLVSPALSR